MRILVTGARGFVGRNLVENLRTLADGRNRTRPALEIDEVWEYDLGDSWRHTLRVVENKTGGINPYEVMLNKAKGACPPEDCGGVWGYAHLIEVMANPEHPEHEDYKEWLGHKLQPGRTNIAKARKAIKDYLYVNLPY